MRPGRSKYETAAWLGTRKLGKENLARGQPGDSQLPGCIPCTIGKAQEPRTLSLFEHLNGTHWDGCTYGGWLATGARRHVRHHGALWHAAPAGTRHSSRHRLPPEAAKRRAKAAACEANNYDFMTWASSSRGGIGREAAAWFTTNFDAKMALASSDSERWRVSGERKRFLQVHSAIIARRNAANFDSNAHPKMGGGMPRARPRSSSSRDERGGGGR